MKQCWYLHYAHQINYQECIERKRWNPPLKSDSATGLHFKKFQWGDENGKNISLGIADAIDSKKGANAPIPSQMHCLRSCMSSSQGFPLTFYKWTPINNTMVQCVQTKNGHNSLREHSDFWVKQRLTCTKMVRGLSLSLSPTSFTRNRDSAPFLWEVTWHKSESHMTA